MLQKQGSTTGTVADTYASVLNIPKFQYYGKIVIHIRNTGVANALKYKVLAYANNGGDLYEEVPAETSLGTETTNTIKIANTAYGNLDIQMVKDTTASTYAIEYCMKG